MGCGKAVSFPLDAYMWGGGGDVLKGQARRLAQLSKKSSSEVDIPQVPTKVLPLKPKEDRPLASTCFITA